MNAVLPEGWVWARIADVTDPVPNADPSSEPESEFGYVDISSIDNRSFSISQVRRVRGSEAPSRARRPIRPNDILFSNVRTYLRNIALVPEDSTAEVCSTGFTVLRPNGAVDPRYLFHYVLTDAFIDRVTPQQTGTHYPATSDRVVRSEMIPLAPLAEQRRIVTKLEHLLSRVDECDQRLAGIPSLIKRFRESILAAACSGRLTADWRGNDTRNDSLPAGWRLERLGALVAKGGIFDGPFGSHLKSSDYSTSGVRVIRLENVGRLRFIGDKETFISQAKYETLRKHTVVEGDIIFASFVADEIRACLLPHLSTPAIAKADCFCIRPRADLVDHEYLLLQLISRSSHDALINEVHGATRPRINTSQLRRLDIRVCPIAEQREIVQRTRDLLRLSDEVERRYAKALVHIGSLAPALLTKAFRGELVATMGRAIAGAPQSEQMPRSGMGIEAR